MRAEIAGLIIGAACVVPSSAAAKIACDRNMISISVGNSSQYLRSAADSVSLEAGRDSAQRAARALSDTNTWLIFCDCWIPASEFEEAARHARKAIDEDDRERFRDEVERSLRAFKSGLDQVESTQCK